MVGGEVLGADVDVDVPDLTYKCRLECKIEEWENIVKILNMIFWIFDTMLESSKYHCDHETFFQDCDRDGARF